MPGSSLVVAPTAMMQLPKVTVCLEPSSAVTSMVLASTKLPQPSISLILFFRIRKWTPLTIRPDTSRLRENALPKLKVTSPSMPKRSASEVNT